ncbi:hypothetical protein JW948_08325 [bacterium]|nr:hypothetical protein [bacterium]
MMTVIRNKIAGLSGFRLIHFCFLLIILYCHRDRAAFRNPAASESGLFISGMVRDEYGPLTHAVVRIQTTAVCDTTDESGCFRIETPDDHTPVVLTAWAPGCFIAGGTEIVPGTDSLVFDLMRIPDGDHPGYGWISAFSEASGSGNCQVCHAGGAGSANAMTGGPDSGGDLPFDEWIQDAHAQSSRNIRFLTMYTGTDVYGNTSPATRFGYSRDYGSFPLPPDPCEPYFGPGYKLDFPSTAGNCSACHVPAAAVDDPYGTDPLSVTGTAAEGIGCDFCHKVWDVRLDPATGMPYDNMPGVLSFEFRRPPDGHQFFAGPYDDVAPGEDTYTPIQKRSEYCAPCHTAKFWDVRIYNSFGEWLESPYSDSETGRTCQDCHMPAGLNDHFARIESGGRIRDPATIFSHRMPGAMDEDLLRHAVTMDVTASRQDKSVTVNVEITNDQTGHHVPTDSPLRHLILLVTAVHASGDTLDQTAGPVLPGWCGQGDPADGNYAGLPGRAYAKILEEFWTGIRPTGAYWNMTKLISDNRIAATDCDRSSYTFVSRSEQPVHIEVVLLFRRAYKQLSIWKSWEDPDIVMAEATIVLD